MSESAHILVVEDDDRLRAQLARYLAQQGFRVTSAENARAARASLGAIQPDLMVLDVMMPGPDGTGETGLELTASLRDAGATTPILLLTARGAPEDRIAGFECGADDYLGKPFDPRELVLRIRAMLRRAGPSIPVPAHTTIPLGRLEFDLARAELRRLGASPQAGTIYLTGGEASLLTALAQKANEVLTREDIAAALGSDDVGERAVDVQITRLRRKIETDPREPRFLHTVRGRGYVLKPGN